MAQQELTGATQTEVQDMRDNYETMPSAAEYTFEEMYCLTKIGKQPEDYDGPQRYCKRYSVTEDGVKGNSCPFHGGFGTPENLDPLANLKHGVFATRQNLKDDLRDYERAFYSEVITEWPERYGIDLENDPSTREGLHALAIEIIRDHRANDELFHDGLTKEKTVYSRDGNPVGSEDTAHYLIDVEQRQRKLILKMKEELGISRKHRDSMAATEGGGTVADLVNTIGGALDSEGHEYDPHQFDG